MDMTLTYPFKNIAHRSMPDWHMEFQKLRGMSRAQRCDAFDMRNTSMQLRNETAVLTKWDTYQNNDKLRDRIFSVDLWREELRSTLNRAEKEKFYLVQEKILTEKCLESLQTPFSVISECLSNRDNRRLTEMTQDYLEDELKNELITTERNHQNLSKLLHTAWERLSHLDSITERLETEISNKQETLNIDENQLNMDKDSALISYKIEPFRALENSLTVEGWMELTKDTINVTNKILMESKLLREKLFQAREQAKNELLAQKQVVDHALRKRVYETQKSKTELEWQKRKTIDSLTKTAREISNLNNALVAKINVAKLADTRAENRTYRPRLELVRDQVVEGLEEEARHVRQTMTQLQNKIEQMKGTYLSLENVLHTIEKDLNNKSDTLEIDRRCQDIRMPMAISYQTQTDRNIQLTNMAPHHLTY